MMGSDHRLCVVSTQLNCRTTHDVPHEIPPLRDWSSTLLRAHVDLCQWSSDVCCRLYGIVPCAVASREVVVDELYQKFLGIVSWHAPRQRCSPRRSQPSWWTSECYATCVAGASDVLCGCTSKPEFRIEGGLFRNLILERLRLPFQVAEAVCECGTDLDREGRHRAACTRSGRLRISHPRELWPGCVARLEQQ